MDGRRPAIKICGVTRVDDACRAEDLGAAYVGLIFAAASPRRIAPVDARAIAERLTRAVPVGVFVEQSWSDIASTVEAVGLRGVQVYREPEGPLAGVMMVHAIPVADRRVTLAPGPHTDYVLCDTFDPRRHGGTGRPFDWHMLPADRARLFVAGGITPHNIGQAMTLGVHAIDVCSSVESRPGIKDPDQLQTLFSRALADEPTVRGCAT